MRYLSSALFKYCAATKTFTANFSDLKLFSTILEFKMVSERTGVHVGFEEAGNVRAADGTIAHWVFKVSMISAMCTPGCAGLTVIVINK